MLILYEAQIHAEPSGPAAGRTVLHRKKDITENDDALL